MKYADDYGGEWITDRVPAACDANQIGAVWVYIPGVGQRLAQFDRVRPGQRWYPALPDKTFAKFFEDLYKQIGVEHDTGTKNAD